MISRKVTDLLALLETAGDKGLSRAEIESFEPDRNKVYSLIYLIRRKIKSAGRKIELIDDKYVLKSSQNALVKPLNLSPINEKIINLLQAQTDGLKIKDLVAACNKSRQCIYSHIKILRKKGYPIKSLNAKYHLKSSLITSSSSPPMSFNQEEFAGINQSIIERELVSLSEADKSTYLDALKQAIYYGLVTKAVVQSHKIVESFRNKSNTL